MNVDLEKLAHGKKIILDNSYLQTSGFATQESILGKLYDNRWEDVSLDEIINIREKIEKISPFLNNGFDVGVIPETITEISELRTQLNNHRKYFQNTDINTKKYKNAKLRKRIENQLRKRKRWIDEEEESFDEYSLLSDDIHSILRKLKHGRVITIDREDPLFSSIYQIAHEQALRREEAKFNNYKRKSKEDLRNPKGLSETLRTDEKIVATAYVLAHEKPVLILSRDKDIPIITNSVYKQIKLINEKRRKKDQIPIPKFDLQVYGPEFENDFGVNEASLRTIPFSRYSL